MKPFETSFQPRHNRYVKWIRWFYLPMALVYLLLFIKGLAGNASTLDLILNLMICISWSVMGVGAFLQDLSPTLLLLNEKGISVTHDETRRQWKWTEIENVNIGIGTFSLRLKSEQKAEINIRSLKYKELQNFKRRCRAFAEAKKVRYGALIKTCSISKKV